jgi:hypothetical protein
LETSKTHFVTQDIRSFTRSGPSLRDADGLHETIDAIERSAAGGTCMVSA